jgi:hypothetical protein
MTTEGSQSRIVAFLHQPNIALVTSEPFTLDLEW